MKKTGIFFGSSSGTTESVANRIAEKLGLNASQIHDVAKGSPSDLANYEVLLLGSSTWGVGDLQDDWERFLPKIKNLDLSQKIVGLFGCGDSSSFSDSFCDSIGILYNGLQKTGCRFIGAVDASVYTFDESIACINGKFVGLPLDEINEDDQTEGRINGWIELLKQDGIE